jgi:hypothetical protein
MELTKEILSNRLFFIMALSGIALLLLTSGWVVGKIMSLIYKKNLVEVASSDKKVQPVQDDAEKERISRDRISTGQIIGKCENLIIYLLTLTGSYTALAIIFSAKSIIRKEDIENNSMFFLAGTMINVTYSLLISIFMKLAIIILLASPVKSQAMASSNSTMHTNYNSKNSCDSILSSPVQVNDSNKKKSGLQIAYPENRKK